MKRQQIKHGHLTGECFGRSNAYLGARMSQHSAVRLPSEHRAVDVADRQNLRALLFRFAHRRNRVGGLTRLRDRYYQCLVVDDRVAIAKLRSVIHLDWNPRQFFEHVLAGHRRMQARSASDRLYRSELAKLGFANLHLIQIDATRRLRDAADGRVSNRARLLVNLLQHVMLEAALLRRYRVPGYPVNLRRNRIALEVSDRHAGSREHRHFAVAKIEHVARVIKQRGNIRSNEVFVITKPDHDGRALPDCNYLLGLIRRHDRKRIEASKLRDRAPDCRFQSGLAFVEILFNQVGDDFRVGLGDKGVVFSLQRPLERKEVLYDSVVNHHDATRAVTMWVSILFGRPSVRSPSRVTNSVCAVERFQANTFFEVSQLAFSAANCENAFLIHDRDSRRIVAAVLELLQPVENYTYHLLIAYVSYYSTHLILSFSPLPVPAFRHVGAALRGRPSLAYQFSWTTLGRPRRAAPTFHLNLFFTFAGTPNARESGGTSSVTTLPAPVTDPRPTRTGATSIVSLPIFTSSSIIVSFLFTPS